MTTLTYSDASGTIWSATIERAVLRCTAYLGWDDEEEAVLTCNAERPGDESEPRRCGHEHAPEAAFLLGRSDDGRTVEVGVDRVNDATGQWDVLVASLA